MLFSEFLNECEYNTLNKYMGQNGEIAYMCLKRDGFCIVIMMYQKDYGPVPFAHVFDASTGKELGQVNLMKNPSKPDDIVAYKGQFDQETKEAIFKWSQGRGSVGINNWSSARGVWHSFRPNW